MNKHMQVNQAWQAVAEVLQHGMSDWFGQPVRIADLHATPLDYFSTHPIHRLRATLDSGRQLTLIFKRLQPGMEQEVRCAREVLIYQRLLAGRRFGAPLLYASLYDEAHDRYWLFLEDVGEWKLEYCEVDDWLVAFRWLARMHAAYYGREEELLDLDCLAEHGPEFYRMLAQAARASLASKGQPHAMARFDRLMRRFDAAVLDMMSQPRTLVHGDMSCHNLIVQPELGIRPVDWEWAAVGLPAWDLVKLLSGWGDEKPRFLAAYLHEFMLHGDAKFDWKAFSRTLAYCEILKVLWYLRWWIDPCHEPAFVDGMLDKIEAAWRRLDRKEVALDG